MAARRGGSAGGAAEALAAPVTGRLATSARRAGDAQLKMQEIKRHLTNTFFCWMGGMEDDSTFYYRVQSPVIIVEFDHQRGIAFREKTKPYKDHIHVIVRTPNGNDYGKDLLRQHYQNGHHAAQRP